jgi:hypothetical protein
MRPVPAPVNTANPIILYVSPDYWDRHDIGCIDVRSTVVIKRIRHLFTVGMIAQEDWAEDTKRYGVKLSGCLTLPMFFDSVYQMVSLWAADLDVSFTGFLEVLFSNIAGWDDGDPAHWKFKKTKDVNGKGEELDEVQNR